MMTENPNRKRRIEQDAEFTLRNEFNNNAEKYIASLKDKLVLFNEFNHIFAQDMFPTTDVKTAMHYIQENYIKPKIICISGKARSGKDTFASMLAHELMNNGKSVMICRYADLLKYICKQFFCWDGEKDEAGRTLLQTVGTDIVRKKDRDFWVNFVVNIAEFFPGEWDYILIPDTRFPNEIERWMEEGFDVRHIRVLREQSNGLTKEQKSHPSETALDDYNIVHNYINNTGTLEDLQRETKVLCSQLLKI